MAVSVAYNSQVTVTETIGTNTDSLSTTAAQKQVTHNAFNKSSTLTSATTPPVTKVAAFKQLMTDGAASIDLTSLNGTNGAVVSMSGLKVQVFKVQALADNANAVTIGEGASNGYELLGNAWTMILQPGQEVLIYGNDATPDVGVAAKTIDLAGTGTQGVNVMVVAG